jgi:hypothetical protein
LIPEQEGQGGRKHGCARKKYCIPAHDFPRMIPMCSRWRLPLTIVRAHCRDNLQGMPGETRPRWTTPRLTMKARDMPSSSGAASLHARQQTRSDGLRTSTRCNCRLGHRISRHSHQLSQVAKHDRPNSLLGCISIRPQ